MSKVLQLLLITITAFSFTTTAQARVWLDLEMHVNSIGQDVYVFTAKSDDGLITSMGVTVEGDGNIAQVHPYGNDTYLMDYNAFFGSTPVDHDTQALFATAADNLLVPVGYPDTDSRLNWNGTGFTPFASRDVAQFVLTGGQAVATIGMVVSGQEYSFNPTAQGTMSALVPEPASLMILAAGAGIILKRR